MRYYFRWRTDFFDFFRLDVLHYKMFSLSILPYDFSFDTIFLSKSYVWSSQYCDRILDSFYFLKLFVRSIKIYHNLRSDDKFKDVRRHMMSRSSDEVFLLMSILKVSYDSRSCLTSCIHECSGIIWYDYETR